MVDRAHMAAEAASAETRVNEARIEKALSRPETARGGAAQHAHVGR